MRCDRPLRVKDKEGNQVAVGCGCCPPCKKRRVDSWVFRLLQEERRSRSSYFITLTYDTDSVPITPNGFMTLLKTDPAPRRGEPGYDKGYIRRGFPDFMKRLRRKTGLKDLKFYAVGEYGSNRKRPHYHAIIFNLDPLDFLELGKDDNGHMKYINRKLAECWPFGVVDIGSVTGDSIAYTCKYIDKPKTVPQHKNDDRLPEFSLMSRGLGDNYITQEIIDYHKADLTRNYLTVPGGYKKAMPRYYRDRIFDEIDKAEQRSIIVKEYAEQDETERQNFHRKYGDDLDFDDYKDEQRKQRMVNHYKYQKTRDYD